MLANIATLLAEIGLITLILIGLVISLFYLLLGGVLGLCKLFRWKRDKSYFISLGVMILILGWYGLAHSAPMSATASQVRRLLGGQGIAAGAVVPVGGSNYRITNVSVGNGPAGGFNIQVRIDPVR